MYSYDDSRIELKMPVQANQAASYELKLQDLHFEAVVGLLGNLETLFCAYGPGPVRAPAALLSATPPPLLGPDRVMVAPELDWIERFLDPTDSGEIDLARRDQLVQQVDLSAARSPR